MGDGLEMVKEYGGVAMGCAMRRVEMVVPVCSVTEIKKAGWLVRVKLFVGVGVCLERV